MNNQIPNHASARRVFAGIFCLLASAGAFAQHDTGLPAPGIAIHESRLAEGRYRLEFSVPEDFELGPDAFYIRVFESVADQLASFAVLDSSRWFRRETAGVVRYQAQLCAVEPDGPEACGPLSRVETVRLPTGLVTEVPADFASDSGPSLQSTAGPSAIEPGAYGSTRTRLNAWHFNWANRLRMPQPSDVTQLPFFDLQVVWETYEFDPGLGRTIPIWLVAQLEVDADAVGTYTGELLYRESVGGQFVISNVGFVEITPDTADARQVDVRWRTTLGGMYGGGQTTNTWVTDTLEFSPLTGSPDLAPLAHDSYSGSWNDMPDSTPDQPVSVLFWIENQVERVDVLFQDAAGRPAWAMSTRTDSTSDPVTMGSERFCAFTVFDGPLPNVQLSGSWTSHTVEYMGCDPGGSSNLGRSFDPVPTGPARSGDFWADLTLPGFRPGSFKYAHSFAPGAIQKLNRFYDIRPVIDGVDGRTTCVVEAGQSCSMEMRWFLDSTYPDAAVYRKTLPSGTPQRIFTNIDGNELTQPHTLPGIGQYEFQIRRNGSASSDLIARSHAIQVQAHQAQQAQFEYDALGRLVKISGPDGRVSQYSYDQAGNRTTITRTGN